MCVERTLPDWQSPASNRGSNAVPYGEVLIPKAPTTANEQQSHYVLSLSQSVSWLGGIAEEMGGELCPWFAGCITGKKVVRAVRTNEVGLDRQDRMKESFEPGMEFLARVTLLAEGAHGSLTKTAVREFDLRRNSEPQTYGMGVKEVWRVRSEKH